MKKIVLIGTGRRVNLYYTPVLLKLKDDGLIKLSGVYNRTDDKGKQISDKLKTKYFNSIEKLIKEKPDIAIISLPGKIKQEIAILCLKNNINIFLETPMSDFPSDIKKLQNIAKNKRLKVEAAEDFAKFPEAIIQKQIIDSGILGKITEVHNECSGFAHHGLARFHTLVDKIPKVKKIESNIKYINSHLSFEKNKITFENLIYKVKFPIPKNHEVRKNGNWQIKTENGFIDNNKVIFKSMEIPFTKTYNSNNEINSISINIDDKQFNWQNPNSEWVNKQNSLYELIKLFIDSIEKNAEPFYGTKKALIDTRLLNSMTLARKTKRITNPTILKLLEPLFSFYKKIRN